MTRARQASIRELRRWKKLGAYDKWVNLVATFEKSGDGAAFAQGYGDLIRQIRAAALKSVELD